MTNKELQELLKQYPDNAKIIQILAEDASRVGFDINGYGKDLTIVEDTKKYGEIKYLLFQTYTIPEKVVEG